MLERWKSTRTALVLFTCKKLQMQKWLELLYLAFKLKEESNHNASQAGIASL